MGQRVHIAAKGLQAPGTRSDRWPPEWCGVHTTGVPRSAQPMRNARGLERWRYPSGLQGAWHWWTQKGLILQLLRNHTMNIFLEHSFSDGTGIRGALQGSARSRSTCTIREPQGALLYFSRDTHEPRAVPLRGAQLPTLAAVP